jgi:thiol-disulfide isomerase/thioredoxin
MLNPAVLYTALLLAANAGLADPAALQAQATGDMRKLAVHEAPEEVSDTVFHDVEGGRHRLSDWRGQVVVLNFWATWCAPCRHEMPSLDRLQAEMGGAGLEVVTVATGRNSAAGIRRFFEEEGIERLPILTDADQSLAREMAVLGLPVTVIIDPEGREVARLTGGAEWDTPEAKAILQAVIEES